MFVQRTEQRVCKTRRENNCNRLSSNGGVSILQRETVARASRTAILGKRIYQKPWMTCSRVAILSQHTWEGHLKEDELDSSTVFSA